MHGLAGHTRSRPSRTRVCSSPSAPIGRAPNAAWYTVNPLEGMYAAVTRETLDGTPEGGWFPEERIDVESALRAYTVNNAWVGMMEDELGRVEPGFLADLAVLDRNPFEVDPGELKDVSVVLTIVGGRIVFEREGA